MSKFVYSRLPRHDIVSVLAESQVASMTEADLQRPKSEFVIVMYTQLLMHLDTLQEDHGQVEFEAPEQVENPDRHVDSVRILNLFTRIKEMLEAIQCPLKFTLKDLLKPDGERTECFVGSMVNYGLHRDGKMGQLKPIYEQLSTLDDYRKELEDRIAEIQSALVKYDEVNEKESPFMQELQSQIQGLNQNIASLNNHQLSLKTTMIKLHEKTIELDEKDSLEDKKLMLADAKNAERSAMQSFHEKKAILEVYTKAGKKMSKQLDEMQAIQEQLSSAKSTEKDVKALKIKLDDERVLDKSLDAKVVEKQGKVEKLDASGKQLQKEMEFKCGEACEEPAKLKMDIESRKHDLFTRQKKVEALVAEVDIITSKTNTVKASGASKQHDLMVKAE